MHRFNKYLTTPQRVVILLSVLACLVLAWTYLDRISSFEASHRALAHTTSAEVSSQVSFILKERQRQVQLFVEDHLSLLEQLRRDPENDAIQKEVGRLLRRSFPDFFAFTITDNQGTPYMVDFDGFVGDICVQDIQTFAKSDQYAARIHPNNHVYHYDVMTKWQDVDSSPYILMVSFEPAELSQILKAIEPPGHELMLITNTTPSLIEVTQKGGRDKTPRSDYRLSQEELTHLLAKHPVQLSGWNVADLERRGFFDAYRIQSLTSLTIFLAVFVAVIGVSLILLRREERYRQVAERDREKLVSEITQIAFHDSLTKLPNRRLLDDCLSHTMAASKRSGCYAALMFLDLDNFKPINDMHGHEAGDLLLIEAANRLRNCVREMDTVARFGGDEFVVILSELNTDKVESISHASIVAEKIRATLSEPYLLTIMHEGKADMTVEHHCTASIGVTLFNGHEASQDNILKWADAAMYQAKEEGRNLIRFYGSTV